MEGAAERRHAGGYGKSIAFFVSGQVGISVGRLDGDSWLSDVIGNIGTYALIQLTWDLLGASMFRDARRGQPSDTAQASPP